MDARQELDLRIGAAFTRNCQLMYITPIWNYYVIIIILYNILYNYNIYYNIYNNIYNILYNYIIIMILFTPIWNCHFLDCILKVGLIFDVALRHLVCHLIIIKLDILKTTNSFLTKKISTKACTRTNILWLLSVPNNGFCGGTLACYSRFSGRVLI